MHPESARWRGKAIAAARMFAVTFIVYAGISMLRGRTSPGWVSSGLYAALGAAVAEAYFKSR